MQTGLGAGLQTVGVTWGFRDRAELESFHPQYIISHPDEVFGQILEKKAGKLMENNENRGKIKNPLSFMKKT